MFGKIRRPQPTFVADSDNIFLTTFDRLFSTSYSDFLKKRQIRVPDFGRGNCTMPISDKQLAANRANAKKSTGPRTPQGKAICEMNGFQHGFTGLAVVMTNEDREAMNAFVKPYIQRLNPIGEIELQLAQTIAHDNFRLNRLKTIEENMFAYGELGPLSDKIETEHARVHHAIVQAQVFVLNDRAFHNLSLYEQRITRNIHKNLKLLRDEQALRKSEELLKAKAKPLTRTASGGNEQNGFDFSSALSNAANPSETQKGPEADVKKAA
jgi:hypothetical protein